MAWRTSASACARSALANRISGQLKRACGDAVSALPASALGARPAIVLAMALAVLGVLTPLLPTSFIAAILVMTGVCGAVLASGANLAAAHKAEDSRTPASSPATAATPANQCLAMPATDPDWAMLMARVNHELRTPLNAVIGFSEVMALEMFGPLGSERYQDYVSHIRASAGDLLKSAEDTLALTALLTHPRNGGTSLACDLEHAVNDAWTFLARRAESRGVDLDLTLPCDVEVMGEPRALRQVLVNLLSEAIARTAPGERIGLMAAADGELIEIVLSAPPGGPRAVAEGSLAICVARTLLEMQGTSLLEIDTAAGWRAVTVLDRAVQPDFFAAGDTSETPAAPERALAMAV